MTEVTKIQPRPTSTSEPYWQGCAEGELRLQQCADCGAFQFYPRVMCSQCLSDKLEWQQATGRGTIAAMSVVRRGVSAAYEGPYVVALMDLQEGPRMMSQIVIDDVDEERLCVGAAVEVVFEAWSDEITVPLFKLID